MKGHIRRRSEGVWALVVDLPREQDGKRRQKWYTVHGNKRAAEKRLAELMAELHAGTHVEPSRMTLAEYYERWFRDYAALRLRPHTLSDYRHLVGLYILPELGRVPIEKLTPIRIQELYTKLETRGTSGRPLSGTTVRHVHKLLSVALRQAIRWRLLSRNPLEGVIPPKISTQPPAVLQDAEALAQLLETARGTWLYMPVVLAVGASLCRGEVLGLRWTDIDFTAGTISVSRAISQVGKQLLVGEPKTEARNRVIEIPEYVLAELRKHRATQTEAYLAQGVIPAERYVIAYPDGSPRAPGNLTTAYGKLAAQAGCPEVTFHGLRHTCATHLLEKKVPAHLVAEVMGHKDAAITLRTYAHVLKRMRTQSAAVMNELFHPAESIELPTRTIGER